MHLSRLFVRNYRSIERLDLRFRRGKNVIVGKNNAGKSNIIRAIDLVLGEATPTYAKAENITLNDFYCWKEGDGKGGVVVKTAEELLIWCELCRDDEEELNFNEINKCWGFSIFAEEEIPGQWKSKVPRRVGSEELPEDFGSIFEKTEDNSDRLYVNPKLKNQLTFEKQLEDKYCFAFALWAKREQDGAVCKEIRFLYREDEQSDWLLAFKAPVRTELLQSAILHSFRDPQNQLRLSSWTWYGKLMKHLTRTHEDSQELRDAFAMVREVSEEVFEQIRENIESSTLKVAFPGTEIHFQFNSDNRSELYKNCVIYVDDGFKSQLADKGAGIQSATIIGLFNYYTRKVNTKTSALLCVEEPEIYLHPHARRVISDRLDAFLDGPRNQVILTTHSVEFIRATTDSLNIILVSKDDGATTARSVNAAEYKSVLTDNNQNELFFAESVIACEGHDEYVIRAIADEIYPAQLDEKNVSVIAVSGKDRLCRVTELVTKLGIRCYLMADFDFLLRDCKPEAKKYDAKAHLSVVDLNRRFFKQPCIFGGNAAVTVKSLKDLRARIKAQSEEAFYTAKRASELENEHEIHECLAELSKCGICILPGELEDLCKDPDFVSAQRKLNLSRVAALHDRIASGQKPSDLFEVDAVRSFLAHVFGA